MFAELVFYGLKKEINMKGVSTKWQFDHIKTGSVNVIQSRLTTKQGIVNRFKFDIYVSQFLVVRINNARVLRFSIFNLCGFNL